MAWPVHKVIVVLCSTAFFSLLLLILLQFVYNNSGTSCCCGDCKVGSPSSTAEAKKEHMIKQAVENEENSSTSGVQQQEVVKVIEEWRLPMVTNDRPHEKLNDSAMYGEARRLIPIGSGAFLFVQFGAYRGGSNTFAVVGLGTKGLHKHGNPGFECTWVSNGDNSSVQGHSKKYYPDWGYGKQYSVVVVHCAFDSDVGVDRRGGRLEMVADHGSWDQTGLQDVHFVALTEEPNTYNGSIYEPPYKYDYLYCGSPIYGSINPQRMREWIAYHVWLLGPRSHFILYDAGGIRGEVRRILNPWIELGFITVMNVRQEARYDNYYHSQFLINNDCLFQSKTQANWTFFFDVDEYVAVPSHLTLDEVMMDYYSMGQRRQQVRFKQNFMNHNHCRNDPLSQEDLQRQWGFEKLLYKLTKGNEALGFSNRKYVIQAQYALSAGVHLSEHTLDPKDWNHKDTIIYEDHKLFYYHYHSTIDYQDELCKEFIEPDKEEIKADGSTYALDYGIAVLANEVREFENRTIGPQPFLQHADRLL